MTPPLTDAGLNGRRAATLATPIKLKRGQKRTRGQLG